jgi:hypothetical protein
LRRAHLAAARHKVCQCCGETFDATRTDAKFCGGACKQRAYRQRHCVTGIGVPAGYPGKRNARLFGAEV